MSFGLGDTCGFIAPETGEPRLAEGQVSFGRGAGMLYSVATSFPATISPDATAPLATVSSDDLPSLTAAVCSGYRRPSVLSTARCKHPDGWLVLAIVIRWT